MSVRTSRSILKWFRVDRTMGLIHFLPNMPRFKSLPLITRRCLVALAWPSLGMNVLHAVAQQKEEETLTLLMRRMFRISNACSWEYPVSQS